MQSIRKLKAPLLCSLLVIGIIYLAACSDTPPLSYEALEDSGPSINFESGKGKDGDGDQDPFSDHGFLMTRKREEAEEGVSRAVIGPAGGVLVHGAHRIEISPGALSEPTELTFTMPVNEPDTLMFDLGPDGTQFSAPVKLVVSFDHGFTSGLDEMLFFVVVFNPETRAWEPVESTVDTELNTVSGDNVTGSLKHFSRYCISKG
ncbi:MAG: hypothetical protein ACE5IY_16470 [bacterium]